MPKTANPYSRLYWRLIDDDKFAEIYVDDHHFALWCRLLMAADMAWPASAALPFGTRKTSFDKLVSVGLVDPAAGNRFRIHGLDAERQRRQTKGRDAVNQRWSQDTDDSPEDAPDVVDGILRYPASTTNGIPRREEKSREEKEPRRGEHTTRPPVTVPTEYHDLQLLAEELTGQPYALANLQSGYGVKATRMVDVHGWEATERAWRAVAADVGGRPTLRQLVLSADDRLDPPIPGPRLTQAQREAAEVDATVASIREEMARASR